jgi:hypothetical protein
MLPAISRFEIPLELHGLDRAADRSFLFGGDIVGAFIRVDLGLCANRATKRNTYAKKRRECIRESFIWNGDTY